jgi:hypothetical protein
MLRIKPVAECLAKLLLGEVELVKESGHVESIDWRAVPSRSYERIQCLTAVKSLMCSLANLISSNLCVKLMQRSL